MTNTQNKPESQTGDEKPFGYFVAAQMVGGRQYVVQSYEGAQGAFPLFDRPVAVVPSATLRKSVDIEAERKLFSDDFRKRLPTYNNASDQYVTEILCKPEFEAWLRRSALVAPPKDQEISVDVSTGDNDAGHRIFARLTGESIENTWLAEATEDNAPAATLDKRIDIETERKPFEQPATKIMRLADDYAHKYSFVGDSLMPKARFALEDAVRAALAAPQQEPLGYLSQSSVEWLSGRGFMDAPFNINGRFSASGNVNIPIYTAPPPPPPASPVAPEVRADVVPGVMHCAKCHFQLTRVTLSMANGNAYAGDNKTEPCPNGCGTLCSLSWEQYARQMQDSAEQMADRAIAAEKKLAALAAPQQEPVATLICGEVKITSRGLEQYDDDLEWHLDAVQKISAANPGARIDLYPVLPTPAAPVSITPDELTALHRVNDCFEDGEGYDIQAEMMQRLAEIGLLRRIVGRRYEFTEFGRAIIDLGHTPATPFQERVQPWMMACFGAEISADKQERNHRFFEEATELVQACDMTRSEAHQLVDYVYARPVGDAQQEVGGVMVTLAALCLANNIDMHAAGETELTRIWTKVEQIRAKQAAKPQHSPLPEAPSTPVSPAPQQNPVTAGDRS